MEVRASATIGKQSFHRCGIANFFRVFPWKIVKRFRPQFEWTDLLARGAEWAEELGHEIADIVAEVAFTSKIYGPHADVEAEFVGILADCGHRFYLALARIRESL